MSTNTVSGVIVNVLRRTHTGVEYLFLQRSAGDYAGQWWPVAGHCHANESATECALRELNEETGLTATTLYDLGKEVAHVDRRSQLLGFVAFVDPQALVQLNYEHSAYQWVDADRAFTLMPPIVHPFLSHINAHFIQVDCIERDCLVSNP